LPPNLADRAPRPFPIACAHAGTRIKDASMLTLFHNKHSRSAPVRWALEELAVPYALAQIGSRADYVRHGFHKVHPLMLMPTLVDDGQPVFETAAICLYLADKYGALAPPSAQLVRRGQYYQWCVFAMTELDRHLDELRRLVSGGRDQRDEPQIQRAASGLLRRATMLDEHLAQRAFMLDDTFSMADILVTYGIGHLHAFGLTDGLAALTGYLARMQARPAWQRAQAPA
jgi:glutathione S-transferase